MAHVLLLADDTPGQAGTVVDHVGAFGRWSRHEVFVFNPRRRGDSRRLALDEFDAVVLHYSLLVTSDESVPPRLRDQLRRYGGLKVQYIQDDYRTVDPIAAAIRDLGIHVLFCLVPEDQIESVWSKERLPGVIRRTTLAGYVPEGLVGRFASPLGGRPVDVGYRSREVPFWLGEVAREKVRIGREFLERAAPYGLRCDIAWREEDRMYGESWIRFLAGCRSVLGTESAVSIVDFDGTIEKRCRDYLGLHPGAGFPEVQNEVLAPFEGNVVLRVVSPRVFEAVAVRTPLVLFPGHYSGVVEPWRHYLPLQPDFSNFEEVVRHLRDDSFLASMAERAERELVASGRFSYRQMVREFDETVEKMLGSSRPRAKVAFGLARLETSEFSRALAGATHPVLRARNAVALAVSAAGLVIASPDLLRLLGHRLVAARQAARPGWNRFLADLFRLAVVRRRREKPGLDFRVESHMAPGGELRLRSVRGPFAGRETVPDGEGTVEVEGAPRVARLVWDHGAVGSALVVRWLAGPGLRLPLGPGGIYDFETASWLASTAPAAWEAALRPLLPGFRRKEFL